MWVDFTAQVYNDKVGNHQEALETTNVVFLKLNPDVFVSRASQGALVKNLPANAGDMRCGFNPWSRKISWRRAWQPTPVFLPGESHGQRSLEGYSPRGHTESHTTEATKYTCTCSLQTFLRPQNSEVERNASANFLDNLEF